PLPLPSTRGRASPGALRSMPARPPRQRTGRRPAWQRSGGAPGSAAGSASPGALAGLQGIEARRRWDDRTTSDGRQPMTGNRTTLAAAFAWIAVTTTTAVKPDRALAQVRPTPN